MRSPACRPIPALPAGQAAVGAPTPTAAPATALTRRPCPGAPYYSLWPPSPARSAVAHACWHPSPPDPPCMHNSTELVSLPAAPRGGASQPPTQRCAAPTMCLWPLPSRVRGASPLPRPLSPVAQALSTSPLLCLLGSLTLPPPFCSTSGLRSPHVVSPNPPFSPALPPSLSRAVSECTKLEC